MKFLLFALVLAFVAHNALGFRFSFSRGRVDMKRVMYAAGGAVQCDLCEMVVGDVQSILKGEEPAIENLLDSLCDDLPQQYRANCTSLVNTYLPILFALIDDMTPAEVCELLTMCPGETELPQVTDRQSLTAVLNRYIGHISRNKALKERRINYIRSLVGDDYLCEACEDVVGYVHNAVACNRTWGEISRFLSPLCELCPSQYRASCQNFFFDLPGDVNDFANAYLDPVTDCEILGFCAGDEQEEIAAEPTPEVEEPTPEVEEPAPEVEDQEVEVEVPIQWVPVEPRGRRIDVQIDNQLYDMSRIAKKKLKKPGKAGKNMKKMGVRGMDRMRRPRSISVQVGDEPAENQVPYDISDTEGNRYETVPAQKKCEVCRYFSSAAEGVLEYNEEDITNGLTILFEDICSALPAQFQDECDSEVKDVLPGVIYQMVLKVMNPAYLCTDMIGICQ